MPKSNHSSDTAMSEILSGLIQAVGEQLQSPQTAYVRTTYERLSNLGLSDVQIREEIADCLGEELDEMLALQRPFDEKNYRRLLDQLPWPDEPESLNGLKDL